MSHHHLLTADGAQVCGAPHVHERAQRTSVAVQRRPHALKPPVRLVYLPACQTHASLNGGVHSARSTLAAETHTHTHIEGDCLQFSPC